VTDARPSIASATGAFGLPAAVTPPGGAPFNTTVFWLPPVTMDDPTGRELQRAEPKRILVIPVTSSVLIPHGTLVVAAEFDGGPPASWKVDEVARLDSDCWRVAVVPA
jgi:hypothetical protein